MVVDGSSEGQEGGLVLVYALIYSFDTSNNKYAVLKNINFTTRNTVHPGGGVRRGHRHVWVVEWPDEPVSVRS